MLRALRILSVQAALAFAVATTPALVAQSVATPAPGQRVALVTGSTSGLGREVALRLAAQGMHVILHGRDQDRGMEVLREIEKDGRGSARLYLADFSSTQDVRTFADAVLRDYKRLDILVNNAGFGSVPNERLLSKDGYEYRFQVNYLSGFLLTRMLLPLVLSSSPARIVNVASGSQAPIDFADVMIEHDFTGQRAYGQSKLAQIMFTFDLAEELRGKPVLVNTLHPATYMDTGMVRRLGVPPRSTVAEGADAVMNLVNGESVGSGGYFNGLKVAKANAQAYDADARSRLHRLSVELTSVGGQ